MSTTKTWNYKSLNISFNGAAITDLNGDATITADGELWEFVEGQNGFVERNLLENSMATVTLPIHATSPQLDIFALADIADRKTGAGPFPYTFIDLNNGDTIIGSARIMGISARDNAEEATERTVTLRVIKHMDA